MTESGGINRLPFSRPGGITPPGRQPHLPDGGRGIPKPAPGTFAQVLEQQARTRELTFSAHARQRLEDRKIALNPEEVSKLARAVDKAAEKGCRSSLLLYRDLAFVAGVASRTIITAVDGTNMKEHVFTNIDSALIVE